MPIKRKPDNMKNTIERGAEKDLLNSQKSDNMEKIVLAGSVIDNKENELSKVCEMNLCNLNLRLVRQLQSISLQSFLQFRDPNLDGRKDARDNADFDITPTCLMNVLKLKFYGLKYLKESDISLENIFKKRIIKISSMKNELSMNRYSGSNRIDDEKKFNNRLRNYLEIPYDSKLKRYLMMKFKFYERKLQFEEGCCCNWISSWLARSKYLRRSGTEGNFERKCKFKMKDLREFVSKCKFKMKGLFYMDNGRLCSNGKFFNNRFSITLMCFCGDGKQEVFILFFGQ
jgi:hypothetical protein